MRTFALGRDRSCAIAVHPIPCLRDSRLVFRAPSLSQRCPAPYAEPYCFLRLVCLQGWPSIIPYATAMFAVLIYFLSPPSHIIMIRLFRFRFVLCTCLQHRLRASYPSSTPEHIRFRSRRPNYLLPHMTRQTIQSPSPVLSPSHPLRTTNPRTVPDPDPSVLLFLLYPAACLLASFHESLTLYVLVVLFVPFPS